MELQIKVNSSKTLADYGHIKTIGLKRVAIRTWWHYQNRHVPTTKDGYVLATVKVETPKAMLLCIQENPYTSIGAIEEWVSKSIVLAVEEA
jgi:hypothetical protein